MADLCMYYSWTMTGPVIWLKWINDCLIAGNEDGVKAAKEQMKQLFDCDDVGKLTEYVDCRLDRNNNSIMFTQSCCRVLRMSLGALAIR